MAISKIPKHGWDENLQTENSFPFTAKADGLARAVWVPNSSAASAYAYITEKDGSNNWGCSRGSSTNGIQFVTVFAVRAGHEYSLGSSSNCSLASSKIQITTFK